MTLRSKLKLEAKHLKKQRLRRQGLINNCKKLKAEKAAEEDLGLGHRSLAQLQALEFLEGLKALRAQELVLFLVEPVVQLLAVLLVLKLGS